MPVVTRATVLLILAFLAVGLGCDGGRPLEEDAGEARLRDLLAIGAAHADIAAWREAHDSFVAAAALDPEEPAIAYDLALAALRLGELDPADQRLSAIDADTPAPFRARVELLRSSLAVERGDFDAQTAALLRAAELDSQEPAYPYALSQAAYRLDDQRANAERGRYLERAFELWPENSRLAAELAQWRLDQSSAEVRSRGAQLVAKLATDSGLPQVQELVDRGLGQLKQEDRAPVALRQALNLLRPGKRFQIDSAALEARLEPRALAEPVRDASTAVDVRSVIRLEAASLLPKLPLADGEEILQAVALADATADWTEREREADLAVLTTAGLYSLRRDNREFERVASLSQPSLLLAAELDSDGLMELVVLGAGGVAAWKRTPEAGWAPFRLEPALAADPTLVSGLLVDFEHDGDLDLLAVDREGRLMLVTHRGESSWGRPEPAPLPPTPPVRLIAGADLDGDNDQDLVLALDGELVVLRNERQGEYVIAASAALTAPAREIATLDYNGDGAFDIAIATSEGLDLSRNLGDGRLARDAEADAEVSSSLAGGLRSVVAADFDLDGDLDLAVALEPGNDPGIVVFQNVGGHLVVAGPFPSTALPARVSGLLALDLDGDHGPDLALWQGSELATVRTASDGARHWIELGLLGLAGKVPLDGHGVRVAVIGQGIERRYETERPVITVGLGARTPAVVRVTWPNGISEYLFEPELARRHVVQQVLRIEGSCPFLYASDGLTMRFVTDILGTSPLGMLLGPGVYAGADPEEYLRLPDWVAWQDGTVDLRITEELREVAYLDQLELVVVDAPQEVAVYNGERWVEPPVAGLDLRLLGSLSPPLAVRDDRGRDVLSVVALDDQSYLTNHRQQRVYQGATELHRLTIELPPELASSAHPALLLEGWLHWANTSVNVARAQDPEGAPVFPYLEVGDGAGRWRRVPAAVGLPAGKKKPIVVDLTGMVDAETRWLRLATDFEVYWDRIAVGEALPLEDTEHRVHRLAPRTADLAYRGFSRWYREAENGPYVFDHADRRPYPWRPDGRGDEHGERVIAWQEHAGYYTAFGAVTDLVQAVDDRLVVFGSGEELALEFDTSSLPPLPSGWRRTLFLHSEGWEKDGDPNVACGQTVEPLPFRGMTGYPCADVAAESESGIRNDSRSRWVSSDRLLRRVERLAGTGRR